MKKLYILLLTLLILLASDALHAQWIRQYYPTQKIVNDIHFLDTLHGWMCAGGTNVSDSGMIYYTSNGGDSWVKQYGTSSQPLFEIRFGNLNTGYCVGGFRIILKTTNGGSNWANINTGFGNYLGDITLINTDTLYISDMTSDEGIWKTTNGGLNFILLTNGWGDPAFTNLFFINYNTGWVAANGYFLRKTTNAGINWTTIYNLPDQIIDVFFIDGNTGWMTYGFSNGNKVAKSTNGGVNWTVLDSYTIGSNFVKSFSGLFFINQLTGWCLGSYRSPNFHPIILITSNGGVNWGYQDLADSALSGKVYFIDPLHGWAYGYWGNGNRTPNAGGPILVLGVLTNSIPVAFDLYQNYPNPFNPKTNIKYKIVKSSHVKLVVFGITGREIITLADKMQNTGTYEVDFSGKNLSSGVYFYKIQINSGKEVFSETKKMILIK